jgi:hypothetical protein
MCNPLQLAPGWGALAAIAREVAPYAAIFVAGLLVGIFAFRDEEPPAQAEAPAYRFTEAKPNVTGSIPNLVELHQITAPQLDACFQVPEPLVSEPLMDSANAPAVNAPAVNAPAVNAPAVNAPAVNAPAVNAPAVNAPAKPLDPSVRVRQLQAGLLASPYRFVFVPIGGKGYPQVDVGRRQVQLAGYVPQQSGPARPATWTYAVPQGAARLYPVGVATAQVGPFAAGTAGLGVGIEGGPYELGAAWAVELGAAYTQPLACDGYPSCGGWSPFMRLSFRPFSVAF